MTNVIVDYSNFSKDNPQVEKITLDLLPNTELVLYQIISEADEQNQFGETSGNNTETAENETPEETVNGASTQLSISMINKGTDETEITGSLDEETINTLIRSLTIFRNQLFK